MRPVPWWWVVRFAAVGGLLTLQDELYPRTQWWQLALIGLAVAFGLEWLGSAYKRAQREVRPRVRCAGVWPADPSRVRGDKRGCAVSEHDESEMVFDVAGAARAAAGYPHIEISAPPPPSLTIQGSDGAEILTITLRPDGQLDVTGDESRWSEGALRFIESVRGLLAIHAAVSERLQRDPVRATEALLTGGALDPDHPVYRKVPVIAGVFAPSTRRSFAITADIGWTPPGAAGSVIQVCGGLEEWAADWLVSLLEGQPVPYPADWGR